MCLAVRVGPFPVGCHSNTSEISALKNLWDKLIQFTPINCLICINVFLSSPITSNCPHLSRAFSSVFKLLDQINTFTFC